MTPQAAKTMDGYIRVSARRGREGPGYISIPVQKEAIQRWATYKGVTIPDDGWHVDEDESGGTQERPGLEAAVARCVAGETGGIVSWKIDRFSRNTEGGLRDLRVMHEVGARLGFVTEDIDTGTPMGKMVYTIMLAQAEAFLENIKASWVEAKTRAVNRGAKVGRTPFGYQRTARGCLEPHPVEAPIVQAAFRASANGSLRDALDVLETAAPIRLTGPSAGTPRTWTMSTARRILANRAYLGEVLYGGLAHADAHEPLVSRAVWAQAQHRVTGTKIPARAYPLAGGLARCSTCGGAMVGSNGGKDKRRMYRCGASGRGETCDAPASVSAEALERMALDHMAAGYQGGGLLGGGAAEGDVAELQAAYDAAEDELRTFAEDPLARSVLGADAWTAALSARATERDRARDELDEAMKRQKPQRLHALGMEDLQALGPEDLRLVVCAVYDAIMVRRGRGDERVRFVMAGADSAVAAT